MAARPQTRPAPTPGDIVFHFEPATPLQAEAQRQFLQPSRRIHFLLGPAGTGKTFVATALALTAHLAGHAEKVFLTRPMVPCGGEELGYLPGTVAEKTEPWLVPFRQAVSRLVFGKLPKDLLEPAPLALLRGWTFADCVAILDEAQNATYGQLKLFISRLGRRSKLLICGDPDQSDLAPKDSGLLECVRRLEPHRAVSVIRFGPEDSTVRDPLLASLLARLAG